ncbi:hypothetical protein HYC85_001139 [Camellia sinensis]|uniref:Fatty acyl-CoA reductase n=1 Tax=Camellia sinensis TaxID=4442 RepID=A0A7J7I4I7_CAMSI|nr:hypothetical protein HYC85_001139 [Camellia sinensis]
MELGSVVHFLENRTILVTGATGFLAKIFVEKILRVQPNVKKLYLLLRASDAHSASQRLHNEVLSSTPHLIWISTLYDEESESNHDASVISKDLFRVLREKLGANLNSLISEKVTPVAGDITCENLGVKDSNLVEEMWKEVDIVVNLAATTNFEERYDVALLLNTLGAKLVLDFAKKCTNIKMLLHISTGCKIGPPIRGPPETRSWPGLAKPDNTCDPMLGLFVLRPRPAPYVSGEREGLIVENSYYMGETLNGAHGLDIEMEIKVVGERLRELREEEATDGEIKMAMKKLGIQRARKFGWPNTYVFTKAMGEMLLGHLKENMPLVIIRPTIITSTFKEPFPGWVEGVRTIDSMIVGYGKGNMTCFLADPHSIIDVKIPQIPGDMVVNAMMVAMVAHANQAFAASDEMMIYHVGSSVANPFILICLKDYGQRYFTEHPWIGKDGKPVIVGNFTLLTSMDSFHRYMTLRYLLPLKGLELVNIASCQYFQGIYLKLRRKINHVMRMIEIYRPYLFFKGIYDDINTEKLRMVAGESGVETDVFYFDPKGINWEEYIMNTHIPGLVRYVFK